MNRYDFAHFRSILAALAFLAAAAQAAQAGPPQAHGAAPTPPTVAPAWLPEWVGAAPVTGIVDYSALYAPAATPAPPIAPGMIVAIDPETGMLTRPTAEQMRALSTGFDRPDLLAPDAAPMLLESLPGGGRILTLNGHYQMFSIARVGQDGRVVTDCAHDAATARSLLVAPAPSRPLEKE